jgi:hypothetical protein
VSLPALGLPRPVRRSPALHVAGPLCRSPCPAALRPLGLTSLPRSPRTVVVLASRRARGLRSPPGLPPCVPPGGFRRRLLGLGRSAPPRVVGYAGQCLLYRWPCPAALRPLGLAPPPPPPRSPLNVLVRTPRRPGGFAHPRGAPLHSSGRGRAAAARVGTLCTTAVVGARRPMPS